MLHVTTLRITHKNYDSFVLAVMRRIHGRANDASWEDATCDQLKDKLEEVYTRLRWLLLNVGTIIPATENRDALRDLNLMLNGDPSTLSGKPAIIENQGDYYLTDRIMQ